MRPNDLWFNPRFISFEVPLGSCGLCQAVPEGRRDLNNETQVTAAQRGDLAGLLQQYLTGAIVREHRLANATWHSTSGGSGGASGGELFWAGHRGYIGAFETWLINVRGRPDLAPLPKWNPANAIPSGFETIDTAACEGSRTPPPPTCTGQSRSPMRELPLRFTPPNLCSFTTPRELQIGPPVQTGIEHSYHDAVHGGSGMIMQQVLVSPSALIFWPWHAFIDDVEITRQSCNNVLPACPELFTPAADHKSCRRNHRCRDNRARPPEKR